jgi:hypothetical protein
VFWLFSKAVIKTHLCRHAESLSSKCNAEHGFAKKPQRAGPQAFFCVVAVLANGDAIGGELCLA